MKPFNPADPIIVTQIVRNDTSRAEQVVQTILTLEQKTVSNFVDMADLYSEFMDGDYHAADHCESLPQFLKKHNIELSPKEITKLVKISKVSKQLEITREQLLKAKVNKVRAIFELDPALDYTDPDSGTVCSVGIIIKDLVQQAGNGKSLKDIKQIVNMIKGKTEGEDSLVTFWKLPVFKSREEFLEETIELAVQLSGDTVGDGGEAKDISRATAVERIFAEARSGFALEEQDGEQGGEFEDEHFVRDDTGTEYETGAE